LFVHLLNGLGTKLKKGEPVTNNPPGEAWPPLAQDIEMTFPGLAVQEVYAVSPDWQGRRLLNVQMQDNAVRIVLPKELLKAYTIVVITPKRWHKAFSAEHPLRPNF